MQWHYLLRFYALRMEEHEWGFRTRALHAGGGPDPTTGARAVPIFQSTSFVFENTADAADLYALQKYGTIYTRLSNPTTAAFEERIASLEGGIGAVATASGQAAEFLTAAALAVSGDNFVSSSSLYGGTLTLFGVTLKNFGIEARFVDENPENFAKKIDEKTRFLYTEIIGNPSGAIADLQALSDVADSYSLPLVVDATFATPYLQSPLDLGADIVMHSLTKYMAGHSDVVMGAAICKDDALAEKLYFIQNSSGAVPGPMDSFLVLRGIKTLHLRMQRHCENAEKIARFLSNHAKVDRVYWPGLKSHPNHTIAKSQMRDFGGMVSFTLKGNKLKDAITVVSNTHYFTLAESLGGVESLCGHPASMTHAAIPEKEREKTGVVDSLIRLSVGVEDISDLLADLENALAKI